MAKITLTDLGSGFGATTAINANFTALEQELQNKVLYRDNPTGEPNQMEQDLDMNGNRILNALASSGDGFIWEGAWVQSTVYELNALVSNSGSSYICLEDHTSSTNFASDLAAGKWELLAEKGDTGPGSGDMLKSENLSGLADTSTARVNLGVEIGVNVQAYDAATAKTNVAQTFTAKQTFGDIEATGIVTGFGGTAQIQPISASVGSNALTISASSLTLDFRSPTLGSGAVSTVTGTPSNLVISSGSTLGTVNGQQSRIAVLAINNASTIELAAVNIAGGNNLDETTLISTTAEGGAGAADSASVIYSTTARSSVAFRVIGYIESTQATAGTWATAPSTIQGSGGNAMQGLMTLGHGQTWQNVTGSRATGTTYYNTTGRPIMVMVGLTSSGYIVVGGDQITASTLTGNVSFIVPPGRSYSMVGGAFSIWFELR